ncbi:MAG: SDR family oxidoreductase [Neisseriaceae bacterium]
MNVTMKMKIRSKVKKDNTLVLKSDKQKVDSMHDNPKYVASNKLKDKVAIITCGDNGIGKAVAIAFAKEGANIVISYMNEEESALDTKEKVEKYGRKCLIFKGDLSMSSMSTSIVKQTIKEFGKLDILINNADELYQNNLLDNVTEENLAKIFRINVFSMFYLTRAALKYLKKGASIINTISMAYKEHPKLLNYSSTKGANLSFTYSLAAYLNTKGIRVNGIAHGPILSSLIPTNSSSYNSLNMFGQSSAFNRGPEHPFELAPAYVYLASNIDSMYVTGQILNVSGVPVN